MHDVLGLWLSCGGFLQACGVYHKGLLWLLQLLHVFVGKPGLIEGEVFVTVATAAAIVLQVVCGMKLHIYDVHCLMPS
jgi:hypothetical protein